MPAYQPPEQSRAGQLVDAVTILVLLFATLFVTTFLTQDSSDGSDGAATAQSVADLGVNPVEEAQYQRLLDSGTTDLATVSAAVDASRSNPDKYAIDGWALAGTAALLVLYLGFVYRTSFREYREVVDERFGPRTEESS